MNDVDRLSPDITVVVPVTERYEPVREVFREYRDALVASRKRFEFVYVLDGDYPQLYSELAALQAEHPELRIIRLGRSFGEATALSAGFEHARAPLIMTLPAYRQVDSQELPRLIEELDGADLLLCRRAPRRDTGLNLVASRLFHWPIRSMSGLDLHDLGCGVRLIRRDVATQIRLYGDQHRFLALLAHRQGFRVKEVDGKQAESDAVARMYGPGVYLRRALDLLSIYFLTRFTKKPLRFFGLIGSASFGAGALILLVLGFQRIVFQTELAGRPMLLLATLLLVLGIQVFALGLIAEIIIFTQARNNPEYTIAEIVEHTDYKPVG